MEKIEPKKPVLHNSHLTMLLSCAYKFEQVYIKGVLDRPGIPLVIGRAVDDVVSENLTRKMESAESLMTPEEIADRSTDAFRKAWDEVPVFLDNEEREMGLETVKEGAERATRSSSLAHGERLAPLLNPIAVQWKFVIDCSGRYPFDLAGTLDCVTSEKEESEHGIITHIDFRDLKVKKQKPSRLEVDHSRQFTEYAMGVKLNMGQDPRFIYMDCVIKPTKTLDARLETFETSRTYDDYVVYQRLLEVVAKMLEKGVFPPADAERPYAPCHRCSLQETCPYYNGRRTIAMPSTAFIQPSEREIHEIQPRTKTTKRKAASGTITADSEQWRNLLP